MIKATYTHTQAIKARAMNAAARRAKFAPTEFFSRTISATISAAWGQDWLRTRLGLRSVTSDAGVEFVK